MALNLCIASVIVLMVLSIDYCKTLIVYMETGLSTAATNYLT